MGISVELEDFSFKISGDFSKQDIHLRGIDAERGPILTSSIVSVDGNIVTTFSGSQYKICNFSKDYISLFQAELAGVPVLFNLFFGKDLSVSEDEIFFSGLVFNGHSYYHIERLLVDLSNINGKDSHSLLIDGIEYFVIWDSFHEHC